ncbi:MAG: type IV pilus assembly protein PilM [Candidatus Omnitrophica bacterium]|nr:type IV pilus assembly protein PilM [Candidatus Omnitrophota bacterium]
MHILLENYFKFIKRLIPHKTGGISVGLDIGPAECKLVAISKNNNSFELKDLMVEPVSGGNINQTIGKILKRIKYPYQTLYTAVSGRGTLIRYIDMPRMSFDELLMSFDIEADKYFPFPRDQIYSDCYILDPQGKGKQMSVMIAASRREMIDQRMKLLSELGIQADFIGINPVALTNAFNVLGFNEEKEVKSATAVALLDMGESVSTLTILVDKLPRFTRDIFIGGQDFTKKISNALGVSFDEAEKLKSNPNKENEEKILAACEDALMNMGLEIKLSFDYFSTEKNTDISYLLLTGGASLLKGIPEFFQKKLDVKVSLWDPLSRIVLSKDLPIKEAQEKSLTLGVALGLAFYDYD